MKKVNERRKGAKSGMKEGVKREKEGRKPKRKN